MQFLWGNDYLSLPRDPQPWLIQDLIPASGLVNIYGKPKAGKSFAALGMAHAIASGQSSWLSFPVLKHGPVAYLQIDTPRGEWANRLETLRSVNMDISQIAFCDMLLTPTYPVNILDTDQYQALKLGLDIVKPVVVFIDTLREAHSGDENDSTTMRNVVTHLVAACRPAAVVLLSHARKDTMQTAMGGDDLMSDNRGSSYIAGRMDSVIKFTPKGMHYKGRSKGAGSLEIVQDEDTGLISLDGASASYFGLIDRRVREMIAEDPGISVNKMATQLATETTYKKDRTIRENIREFLITSKLREFKKKAA